jgi:hypothetical protein
MSIHNPLFTILQKFPTCSNSCTSYGEFREIFEATMYGGVEVNLHAQRPRLKFEERNQLHVLGILLPGKNPSSI